MFSSWKLKILVFVLTFIDLEFQKTHVFFQKCHYHVLPKMLYCIVYFQEFGLDWYEIFSLRTGSSHSYSVVQLFLHYISKISRGGGVFIKMLFSCHAFQVCHCGLKQNIFVFPVFWIFLKQKKQQYICFSTYMCNIWVVAHYSALPNCLYQAQYWPRGKIRNTTFFTILMFY